MMLVSLSTSAVTAITIPVSIIMNVVNRYHDDGERCHDDGDRFMMMVHVHDCVVSTIIIIVTAIMIPVSIITFQEATVAIMVILSRWR